MITSKCDCLDRVMFLLAFLDSPGVFFCASYDWNCRLHAWSLARFGPRPVPFPFFCAWNSRFASVWMERNRNVTVSLTATVQTNITVGHQTKSDHDSPMSAQTVGWADKMTGQKRALVRTSIEQ